MRSRELAKKFLQKAREDEVVLDKLLADPDLPDGPIGFHAQQAVEKMLKAVLAIHAVRFGKLHEIGQILALLRQNNIAFPSEFEELDQLTPYAVDFRYPDVLATQEQTFDRAWAREMVTRVKAWAEAQLSEGKAPTGTTST
jgi:HEPN domain-containing protein